jgi:hypothetical protein
MPRKSKVRKEYDTMLVLSAACAAQRVNGNKYIKYDLAEGVFVNDKGEVVKYTTNRDLVETYIEDQSYITDIDRDMAEKVRSYWNGKTFKLLTGEYMSDFDRNMLTLMQKETVTEGYDVAVLASMPNSYQANLKRDEKERRVKYSQGGYIGTVGERVNIQVEVLKCVFSQKWFTHFVTGITSSDQAVFFSYKEQVTVGNVLNIAGTVKRQDNNQTQLNRVKVLF